MSGSPIGGSGSTFERLADRIRRCGVQIEAVQAARTSAGDCRAVQDGDRGGVLPDQPSRPRLREAQVATAHVMVAEASYCELGAALLNKVSGRAD